MHQSKWIWIGFLVIFFIYPVVSRSQQQSGKEFRRSGIMNGNLVRSVYGNWGVIGQPADKGPRGAWINDNNGYVGDVSLMVGAEVVIDTLTFHSVVVSPVDRPTKRREESPQGIAWGFEPVSGYFNENSDIPSISTDRTSWPPYWPDKMSDNEDPGWTGTWNGFFGKDVMNADQESYFVMDDNSDEEFNYATNNRWNVNYKPSPDDLSRNGLGLEVKVRGMQWAQFLASDCIFWLYEITNHSQYDYNRVTFGMLVGTYVGTSGTADFREYDDDWSFFDVTNDITWTGDYDNNCSRNPKWIGPVGMVGYAFLESPGNAYDGIDNDGDAENSLAPLFTESDFDSTLIIAGMLIALIDQDFNRTVITVPNYDTTVTTRGKSILIKPGITKLSEGNLVRNPQGEMVSNTNSYDGIDNDLDGLIDENYYLHYHQIKKDQFGNVLFDMINPLRYKDYITGLGVNDPLIDEKRNDGIDNDGDWNSVYDDVGADGKANTFDIGENDGVPTSGEPNFDQTDVDESDQIGLTSFEYFTPSNDINLADDEELWYRLRPGFFEVPVSIQNGIPQYGEDGDFLYSSGYFPLRAGQTERISLALVYGHDQNDLMKNRATVQKIYNSDYRFPQPPDKPTLTAIADSGRVILYWDRKAELSIDPVLKENDFEGYKIYKSTDPDFNDIRVITNADGTVEGYKSLAQFDLDNLVSGYFKASDDLYDETRGFTYNLGSNSGLKHSYIDTDVQDGKRYYYALVAYDRGDNSKDIFPSENTKFISILNTGEIVTDINTAVITPKPRPAGYVRPAAMQTATLENGPATGAVGYQIINETALTGHTYRIEFWDTSMDSVDNDKDWSAFSDDVGSDGNIANIDDDSTQGNSIPDVGELNLDRLDPQEIAPVTSFYRIFDENEIVEEFTVPVRGDVIYLADKNISTEGFYITDMNGNTIAAENYKIDYPKGRLQILNSSVMQINMKYVCHYYYYPVVKSSHIKNSPYDDENLDADIFDGVELVFDNDWTIALNRDSSSWQSSSANLCPYQYSFGSLEFELDGQVFQNIPWPADYEIEFYDTVVDTSASFFGAFEFPVNFKIKNTTDNHYIDFAFNSINFNGLLSPRDELYLFEKDSKGEPMWVWYLYFDMPQGQADTVWQFRSGDKLELKVNKPFRSGDTLRFTTPVPTVEVAQAKEQLVNIRVVPNPYVVAHENEAPLPPGVSSGRGERRIDFINVPSDGKIHIFTNSGEYLITLTNSGTVFDGVITWNLKTKENLDVAAGVYFYVLESAAGKKSGKIAIIK